MSNRQVADDLYRQLEEVMRRLPDRIENAADDGPVIKIIIEGLGKALDAVRTTIRTG